MRRDYGEQTNKCLFELLDPDFSLYNTGYSKYIMILELRIQEYPTKIKTPDALQTPPFKD